MLRQRLRILVRISLVLALILSSIVTAVEWWQNPGGIYRSASGTDWSIVQETWSSWFVPTLLTAVGASMGVLGIRYLVSSVGQRGNGGEGTADSSSAP